MDGIRHDCLQRTKRVQDKEHTTNSVLSVLSKVWASYKYIPLTPDELLDELWASSRGKMLAKKVLHNNIMSTI